MSAPIPTARAFALSPTHEPILRALARHRYLTQRQLGRRCYAPGSRSYPSARLRPLVAAGYVAATRPPRPTRAGSTETVYFLAGKGRAHVQKLGIELPERFRPREEEQRTYEHYAHALAISDVGIAADLLAERDRRFAVEALLPDRLLRRRPIPVALSTADPLTGLLRPARRALIPDAYLLIRFDDGAEQRLFPILLELDRGTEGSRVWREKVRAYLAAISGPYQAVFGQDAVTIAVVAPAGERRARQLLDWIAAELVGQERRDAASIFLVTGLDPAETDPGRLFLAPAWRAPGESALLPLLELPGAP